MIGKGQNRSAVLNQIISKVFSEKWSTWSQIEFKLTISGQDFQWHIDEKVSSLGILCNMDGKCETTPLSWIGLRQLKKKERKRKKCQNIQDLTYKIYRLMHLLIVGI